MERKKLAVEYLAVSDLIPYARNSRTHSDEQVAQIASSIRSFGFTNPILISPDNDIIAGHGRALAAAKVGIETVPCIRLDHLSETERKAYVIADNRLALNAGWDTKMLELEVSDLMAEGFDLELLGFEEKELEALVDPEVAPGEGLTDPDAVPEQVETRCKPGDLWTLGSHRLLCGDSTNVQHVERLMGGEKADMVYTDPPYGIALSDDFSKVATAAKAGKYRRIEGDESQDVAREAARLCLSMKIPIYIFWGANYYAHALPEGMSWLVWDKQTHGDVFSECELAWTSKPGRIRKFTHQWQGMIKASERGETRTHPTQKPVALAEWCFGEYGAESEDVLDLFLGSGSTLIACEKTARRCFGMEIDPKYVDVILKRWENFTGKTATLVTADG